MHLLTLFPSFLNFLYIPFTPQPTNPRFFFFGSPSKLPYLVHRLSPFRLSPGVPFLPMLNPVKAEYGHLPGQQQQVHQHQSINFHSTIPIKKRRFPIIRPPSPEESIPDKRESQTPDEEKSKNNQESPIHPVNDASKTSAPVVTKDDDIPSNMEMGQSNVETIASGPQEAKPTVSLDPVSDNISSNEKISLDPGVLGSCTALSNSIVKQEIVCGPEHSMGSMSVELSLGLEQHVLPGLERKKSVDIWLTPEKSDPSQLSLALSVGKPSGFENSNCTVETNRSNWDLNTTMKDWEEGSSKSDSLFGHICSHHEKEISSLTTDETVDLGLKLNKGKNLISDVDRSNPPNITIPKIDDFLGLRLAVARREHLSLSGSFVSNSATSNLGLQQVHMSAMNMNQSVKLEPVDESFGRDCSVGSSSSSSCNMVLPRLGSVKMESFNNRIPETVLKSSVNSDKLVNHDMSMNNAVHQGSCASSSSSLTVPLMPQNCIELPIHNQGLQLRQSKIDNKHKLARVDEVVADDEKKVNLIAVDNSVGICENVRGKQDEDLEEGEVWEPVHHPAIEEGPINMGKKLDSLEFSSCGFENSQVSGDQDFNGKYSKNENADKSNSNNDSVSVSFKPNSENNNDPLQNVLLDTALEEDRVDEDIFVSLTPDKQLDLSGRENFEHVKEISSDRPTNMDIRISRFDVKVAATTDDSKSVRENISTLSNMVEASSSSHDAAKDSCNKNHIINLSHASVVTSPFKTRYIPNRPMIQRSGKERYSDLDGEIQPRGNREEIYGSDGGSNKFTKNTVNDQSLRNSRNSRPNFMQGRRRMSDRFDSLHSNEWDSDHDFASETSYGTPKYTNRDRPANRRNNQTFRRFPRNRSPNGRKFTRHLSDDIMNPVYNHPQAMYDEFDGNFDRGNRNRNFSNMQRKGYSRIPSKSPVRSRTRSPRPWSSPRRRSPNGFQDLTQNRSQGFYRMRSPDRGCFREEMVSRRCGSPYITRHLNNDVRRMDMLDSREMEDGDEYMNDTLQSNKFYDDRRNFERCGPGRARSFQQGYNSGDGENFRFHMNDGARPYRFCAETNSDFVDNMREREFGGRIKHQPMGPSRRNRNDDMQDEEYRPVERIWHEGFDDGRGKRRRF